MQGCHKWRRVQQIRDCSLVNRQQRPDIQSVSFSDVHATISRSCTRGCEAETVAQHDGWCAAASSSSAMSAGALSDVEQCKLF